MNFTMTKPCPNCPFRSDIEPFLTKARAREIVSALIQGQTFQCHKTVDYSEKEDGDGQTKNAQHCAGALIFLERIDRPNQMMRWMERVGAYDRTKLDMAAPIIKTPSQMAMRRGR